jgi:hypothetical protein
MSCRVMSCRVMLCRVMSCHVISCRAMSCRAMSCRVMSCRVMSRRVMSCHVMYCYVVWCLLRNRPFLKNEKVHTKLYSMRFSRVEKGEILYQSMPIIARFQIMKKSSVDWIMIDSLMRFRLFSGKMAGTIQYAGIIKCPTVEPEREIHLVE